MSTAAWSSGGVTHLLTVADSQLVDVVIGDPSRTRTFGIAADEVVMTSTGKIAVVRHDRRLQAYAVTASGSLRRVPGVADLPEPGHLLMARVREPVVEVAVGTDDALVLHCLPGGEQQRWHTTPVGRGSRDLVPPGLAASLPDTTSAAVAVDWASSPDWACASTVEAGGVRVVAELRGVTATRWWHGDARSGVVVRSFDARPSPAVVVVDGQGEPVVLPWEDLCERSPVPSAAPRAAASTGADAVRGPLLAQAAEEPAPQTCEVFVSYAHDGPSGDHEPGSGCCPSSQMAERIADGVGGSAAAFWDGRRRYGDWQGDIWAALVDCRVLVAVWGPSSRARWEARTGQSLELRHVLKQMFSERRRVVVPVLFPGVPLKDVPRHVAEAAVVLRPTSESDLDGVVATALQALYDVRRS